MISRWFAPQGVRTHNYIAAMILNCCAIFNQGCSQPIYQTARQVSRRKGPT